MHQDDLRVMLPCAIREELVDRLHIARLNLLPLDFLSVQHGGRNQSVRISALVKTARNRPYRRGVEVRRIPLGVQSPDCGTHFSRNAFAIVLLIVLLIVRVTQLSLGWGDSRDGGG